jgi:hypothetical protein
MPFFECKVSRAVFTDDLRVTWAKQNIYVEAKDEIDATGKAGHPANWLGSAGKADKSSSFLLKVEKCRQLADHEVKALRPVDPAFASTQSPFGSEHDDNGRAFVSVADLRALERSYAQLWRRVYQLNADLEQGADMQWVQQGLEQALDEALLDYTRWRAAWAILTPGDQ